MIDNRTIMIWWKKKDANIPIGSIVMIATWKYWKITTFQVEKSLAMHSLCNCGAVFDRIRGKVLPIDLNTKKNDTILSKQLIGIQRFVLNTKFMVISFYLEF